MMGKKKRSFAPLIHVSLEELVPQDHFYRHLDQKLDLAYARTFVQETYAGGGRLSPVVFFKPQLVMFFENIRDEIEQSIRRISTLIQAVKEYSYMDQAPLQEVDVHAGLESTLIILGQNPKVASS
jgi:hypothetical protein